MEQSAIDETIVAQPPVVTAIHYPWWQAWGRAVFRPSVRTYEELAADPAATNGRATYWVGIPAAVVPLFVAALSFLGNRAGITMLAGLEQSMGFEATPTFSPPIQAMIGLWVNAALVSFIARRLGGQGTFTNVMYTFAAVLAPLTLITDALSLPAAFAAGQVHTYVALFAELLVGALAIYQTVLGVFAVRAVHRISWSRATTAVMLPVVIVLAVVAAIGMLFGLY